MKNSIQRIKAVEYPPSNSKSKQAKKIVVGLSGGVDSSLAAAILVEKGWNVEGLTLWLMKGQGSCCSEGLVDAAGICEDLGINHHIIDSRDLFAEKVIKNTISGYQSGITPLPCSMCNKNVKFEEMLNWAKKQSNFTYIATGHYARIKQKSDFATQICDDLILNDYLLLRGLDQNKDQSYFLYTLSQEILHRLHFPLGEFTKQDTRNKALKMGLRTSNKPESQDLCLVEKYGSMQNFLGNYITNKKGQIKHINGQIVGEHQGIQNFTIGQRKGLGVSWSEPLYVKKLDPINNIVYVASPKELMESEALIKQINWVSIENPQKPIEADVQIRYRSKPVKCVLTPTNNANENKIVFKENQSAITPGQGAVFYRGEILLGGGLIS